MKRDLLDLASSMTRRGVAFVMATVVRRDGSTPAHVGDMALVTGDGAFHGWIGNQQMRALIEREAVRALLERKPCLLCLSSSPDRHLRPGVYPLPLPDGSEGTVEVYLAPVLTSPRLVLLGRSPVMSVLATLARAIGYRVDLVDAGLGDPERGDAGPRADELHGADRVFRSADDPRLLESDGVPVMAVVASDGDGDVAHVAAALAMSPVYLGVIASRRRFTLLRDALVARGFGAALDRIDHPAGLALGAHDPGEVAVSILAQMIARRNGVLAVNEASVTLSEASEVTSTMDVVIPAEVEAKLSAAAAASAAPAPIALPPSAQLPPPPASSTAAATASCFPTPVQDESNGVTMALRVRASSPSMARRDTESETSDQSVETNVQAEARAVLPRARGTGEPAFAAGPSDGTPELMGLGGGAGDGTGDGADDGRETEPRGDAIDPVCQARVAIDDARHLASWERRTWYFCCAACRARFLANPLRYSVFAPAP